MVRNDGAVKYLTKYKTYTQAGKMLGLTTASDLNKFWAVVNSDRKTVKGWRLYNGE